MSEQTPQQPWQPPGGVPPQPPPQPPQYGQAPQRQQPQPPYGAAPDDPGPPPRPVRIASILLLVQVVLGVVSSILFVPSAYEKALAQQPAQPGVDPQLLHSVMAAVTVATIVISIISLGLWVLFVAMAWRGRNWARIVLTVFIAVSLASLLFTPISVAQGTLSLGQVPFLVVSLAISVVALLLLWREPAKGWYNAIAAYKRTTGTYPKR